MLSNLLAYNCSQNSLMIFVSLWRRAFLVAQRLKHLPAMWETQVRSLGWEAPLQPTPVFLPGESLGERSLVSYSPRGHKELGTTEPLHFHTFMALVVISPPSFLVFPWVLSLFFLGNLIKGLSILFIFSKNQLIVSLIFSIFFWGGGTLFYLFPF